MSVSGEKFDAAVKKGKSISDVAGMLNRAVFLFLIICIMAVQIIYKFEKGDTILMIPEYIILTIPVVIFIIIFLILGKNLSDIISEYIIILFKSKNFCLNFVMKIAGIAIYFIIPFSLSIFIVEIGFASLPSNDNILKDKIKIICKNALVEYLIPCPKYN